MGAEHCDQYRPGLTTASNSGAATAAGRRHADAERGDQLDLSAFITYLWNILRRGRTSTAPATSACCRRNSLQRHALLGGYLLTLGNLSFKAADIYPATDTAFVIRSSPTDGTAKTVTFAYPDGSGPSNTTPLSAGGALLVDATNIVQNGQIQAPFGSIILGHTGTDRSTMCSSMPRSAMRWADSTQVYATAVSTQNVTLGSGSITSVSANGMVIPFGNTVDQTTWIYKPQLNNPTWNGGVSTAQSALYQSTDAGAARRGDIKWRLPRIQSRRQGQSERWRRSSSPGMDSGHRRLARRAVAIQHQLREFDDRHPGAALSRRAADLCHHAGLRRQGRTL